MRSSWGSTPTSQGLTKKISTFEMERVWYWSSISVTFLGDSRYSRESATLRSDSTLDWSIGMRLWSFQPQREIQQCQRFAVCDESVRWHLRLRQHLSFVRWNTLQSHTKPLLLPWSLLLEYLPLCDLPRAGDTSKCRGREQRKCQAVHSQWPGTLKQKRQVLKYLLIVAKFCNLFSAN